MRVSLTAKPVCLHYFVNVNKSSWISDFESFAYMNLIHIFIYMCITFILNSVSAFRKSLQ